MLRGSVLIGLCAAVGAAGGMAGSCAPAPSAPAAASPPAMAGAPARPPRTLILGAFRVEVRLLQLAVEGPREEKAFGLRFVVGRLGGRDVVVGPSGVGKVNAAMAATAAILRFAPSEVIFTGVAGGLNPELRPGDIVLAARVAHHDYGDVTDEGMTVGPTRNPFTGQRNQMFFPADERLLALAVEVAGRVELESIGFGADQRKPRILSGAVVTGDVFIASEAKRRQLRQDLQADATEMEGAAVAQVCHQLGLPHLVIRSLSDNADSRAVEDLRKFHVVAARNSAALVQALVARLHLPAPATRPASAPAATAPGRE